MDQTLVFDAELIKRYDKAGPRYTSYPTALQFNNKFTADDYAAAAQRSNMETNNVGPLSLYFHVPFCSRLCFYCGCNKIVTKRKELAEPYLQDVYRELALQAALFSNSRVVKQLHWGGGTPTFISHEQMAQLMAETRRHFQLANDDDAEISIEVDPRELQQDTLQVLRQLGFNRLSLGIQDINPAVQEAVNRIQPLELTLGVMAEARRVGFKSVNVDLIYGLPLQTIASFQETIDAVIKANPDRLSVFNYAHMPELFKPQRRINAEDLPAPADKLKILQNTITQLTDAGYVYIGMDHFAKPDDELAVAQRNRTLYRNFQGYSTSADCDLIALGVTSISKVANTYSQNVKTLEEYKDHLQQNRLPVMRGVTLDADDILRRAVITELLCHFELNLREFEQRFNIVFLDYFAQEWASLEQMEADGLLSRGPVLRVLPRGRLLIRNIGMVFDKYLRQATSQRFSKVI